MIVELNSRTSARKPRPVRLPDSIDLARLCTAIERDRRDLEPFRRNRRAAVEQLGGKNYGENASPAEVPVNLIGLYVQTMTRSLVANNPRVMYSTFDRGQAAIVAALEAWANDEIVAMNAVETYRRVVTDALFWRGQVKIGLATPVDAALDSWDLKAGQPFMEAVDPDDFFEDQTARCFEACSYRGHRYRVPLDLANEMYAKGKRDQFEASERADTNAGGDERIETLGRGTGRREEFEDHCDLWEIYLARHRLVVTLRDAGGIPDSSKGPVRVQPWLGPYCGPYHDLFFGVIPGNLQPKAPIMDLIDLHLHYNRSYRKLLRQTKDYKKGLAYRANNSDAAKRWKDSVDGELFECDNPEAMQPIETGGPSNAVLVMSDHMRSMFDFIGGNLALLGGRGAQSKTATQDKMLNENASAGVLDFQDQALSFVQRTMEAMNWYWWHHPVKNMRSQVAPPSLPNLALTRTVTPAQRRGPMPNIKVDPFALPRQTPQGRLAFINQVLQTMAPMMQLAQAQGLSLDLNELMDLFARYGNEPDLQKLFHATAPPDSQSAQGGGGSDGPGMPANTTRTYQRYGAGGDSQAASAADLTQDISRMEGTVNPNRGGQ